MHNFLRYTYLKKRENSHTTQKILKWFNCFYLTPCLRQWRLTEMTTLWIAHDHVLYYLKFRHLSYPLLKRRQENIFINSSSISCSSKSSSRKSSSNIHEYSIQSMLWWRCDDNQDGCDEDGGDNFIPRLHPAVILT